MEGQDYDMVYACDLAMAQYSSTDASRLWWTAAA